MNNVEDSIQAYIQSFLNVAIGDGEASMSSLVTNCFTLIKDK